MSGMSYQLISRQVWTSREYRGATLQRKFIGNAVEVNMARCMAQALSESLPGVVEVHEDQMKFEFRKAIA